jgi:4-amino-4-deoxy-L-arabinose transferase-like glycosyltransferase
VSSPAPVNPPVALPHTWRPLGVRIMLWVVGTLLIALLVAVWFGLGDDIRSQFTVWQRITLVLFGVLLFITYYGLLRCKVVARADGLQVVNGYRTRRFEWSQVIGLSLPRGAPWATLDLSSGTTVSVMAVQGSDGARARQAARELRVLIATQTPS